MEVCNVMDNFSNDMRAKSQHFFELLRKPLKKDEFWYLVEKNWFNLACENYMKPLAEGKYEDDCQMKPGPIDNTPLFASTTGENWDLRKNLQEDIDFVYVPEEAWELLTSIFGTVSDQHAIRRQVIEKGEFSSYCVVELYLIELKLCLYNPSEDVITKSFSRLTTISQLESVMKCLFKVDPSKDTQLWSSNELLKPHVDNLNSNSIGGTSSISSSYRAKENQNLDDAGLYSGSVVTLEVRNLDGTWPSDKPKSGISSTRTSKTTPGLCGLMNLGNTCFMNSALQCLSNTPPLVDYFLSGKHREEINVDNPIGMKGEIVKSFGELVKAMWSGSHTALAPREFKFSVGRFAPQFSGFQQQDCQELMAFLLDGLHEDLNRVKQKPYIPIETEFKMRPDAVVAAESWLNHKRRNDSIVVDLFHSLLKSTVVCPECALVSVTFDPLCFLSLPLPAKKDKAIEVTFIPSPVRVNFGVNQAKPKHIPKLMVPKYGLISDICNAAIRAINDDLPEPMNIDTEKLVVTEITNHRFRKIFNLEDTYHPQLEHVTIFETVGEGTVVPVLLREILSKDFSLFGRPLIIRVNDFSYETLHELISSQLKQFMKLPSDDESDTDEGVAECERSDQFTISLINSTGFTENQRLEKNKPFRLPPKCHLAADFTPAAKEKYFVDNELELIHLRPLTGNGSITSWGKSSVNLSDCIAQFTNTERLGADDAWFCPKCKRHQQATKKLNVWSLPKVLIIHLKRFSYSRSYRDKLDTFVDFPITDLNMSEYIINNPNSEAKLYDLIAVVNHFGGLGGGHYTAYCKNRETKSWHYFDDSNVSLANEDSVVSNAAYVLFYLRKD